MSCVPVRFLCPTGRAPRLQESKLEPGSVCAQLQIAVAHPFRALADFVDVIVSRFGARMQATSDSSLDCWDDGVLLIVRSLPGIMFHSLDKTDKCFDLKVLGS